MQKANPLVKNPYSQGHFGNENSVGAGTKSWGCKEQPHYLRKLRVRRWRHRMLCRWQQPLLSRSRARLVQATATMGTAATVGATNGDGGVVGDARIARNAL